MPCEVEHCCHQVIEENYNDMQDQTKFTVTSKPLAQIHKKHFRLCIDRLRNDSLPPIDEDPCDKKSMSLKKIFRLSFLQKKSSSSEDISSSPKSLKQNRRRSNAL